MLAKITEQGNGFPIAGSVVRGSDDEMYEVLTIFGPIHTGNPGAGNYIYAEVASDCGDDAAEEYPCECQILPSR